MAIFKTQQQLDEQADLAACNKPETTESCEHHCIDESGGIMSEDSVPFCNTTGKNSLAVDAGGSADLRDGSSKKPIQLTGLQEICGISFAKIMAMKQDGTVMQVKPPQDGCKYRLIADKKGYSFVKDVTTNEFDAKEICVGATPDYVLGGKVTQNACGEAVMKLAVYDISLLLDQLDVSTCP